jgi:Transposase DDE domain group 1
MQGMQTRPHVQGDARCVGVEFTKEKLTDAPGLLSLRAVMDGLGIGAALDRLGAKIGGGYRPSLMVEQWLSVLWYGGGCMDHLEQLEARGVRELFGWAGIPDPTTYGRWLRRAGDEMGKHVEAVEREAVSLRWSVVGVPKEVMLIFDATVQVRYGQDQAGAEIGYNPHKKGRPSHHPLVGFLDTGDCVSVRWRAGNEHCAAGIDEELPRAVAWLRAQGVERITVRLDKGFFSRAMVELLQKLDVDFVLKKQATVLTNIPGIDAVEAWRLYNQGAVVEQRIEELGQLGVGKTAVDDLGGNRLLWSMGALAYQLLHFVRTVGLPGQWRKSQVKTLRMWLIRMPAKVIRRSRNLRVKLVEADPLAHVLWEAIQKLQRLRGPTLLLRG